MRWLAGVLLAIAAAPAARADWEPPTRRETGVALAAGVLIAFDAAQTCTATQSPTQQELAGPNRWLWGPRPSCGQTFLSAGAATLLLGGAWYLLPHPWRSVLAGSTIGVELVVVAGNAGIGFRW